MHLSPRALARASSRRPWLTIGIWLLALVVAGTVTSRLLGDALTTDVQLLNQPEAKRAQTVLEERMRGPERATEMVIVSSTSATVDDPAFRTYVDRLRQALAGLGPEVVLATQTYYESGNQDLVSADRRTTLIPTVLAGPKWEANQHVAEVRAVLAQNQPPGFRVQAFGVASLSEDFNTVAEEDLAKGESIGIMAALVILVVVFGAVVAAVVPILVALAAIALALGLVAVVGQAFSFSFFVTNVLTMMGLAVGIDYSLFIVSRYREERRRGREKLAAIEAAGATASRAVFISGMTVVVALVGMILIPNNIFRSVAGGAIFVVVAAVVASLTVLPAVLALLGDRIDRLRVRRRSGDPRRGGFWDRVTHAVMARPVVALVLGPGVLVAAAASAFDMRTGFSGVSTMPEDIPSKQAFETLVRDFPGGLSAPVESSSTGRSPPRPSRGASIACGPGWPRTASSGSRSCRSTPPATWPWSLSPSGATPTARPPPRRSSGCGRTTCPPPSPRPADPRSSSAERRRSTRTSSRWPTATCPSCWPSCSACPSCC